ncbi:MAG: nitrilase family protein [Bacteroidales bacterium]|jgi:predicted amidohydrolase|nr:nitrilase family protein [Bacteroidales bacterium]
MNIAIVQNDTKYGDIPYNLTHLESLLSTLKEDTNLIILQEEFSTGFTTNASLSEKEYGKTFLWMKNLSQKKNVAVLGTILIEEEGKFFNRAYFFYPNGEYISYDKRNLFILSEEKDKITKGEKKVIVEYLGWRIAIFICFDLRFPLWMRNTYSNGEYEYDIALFPSSWAESRIDVFDTLLKGRAIENLAYVAGVNRIGKDETGVKYSGHSQIISYKGETIIRCEDNKEEILYCQIDRESLKNFRKKFPIGEIW